MSELMPEVGDLWIDENIETDIVHIFGIYQNSWGKYVCYGEYSPDYMEVSCNNIGLNLFLNRYKYLGKSKANINQLFEVDDEM